MSDQQIDNSVAQSWFRCFVDIGVILGLTSAVTVVVAILLSGTCGPSLFLQVGVPTALFIIGFIGWAADWKVKNVLSGCNQLVGMMGNSFTKIMILIVTFCAMAGIFFGFIH